jgi:hypothetical protein
MMRKVEKNGDNGRWRDAARSQSLPRTRSGVEHLASTAVKQAGVFAIFQQRINGSPH